MTVAPVQLITSGGVPVGIRLYAPQGKTPWALSIQGGRKATMISLAGADFAHAYERAVRQRLAFLGMTGDACALAQLLATMPRFIELNEITLETRVLHVLVSANVAARRR